MSKSKDIYKSRLRDEEYTKKIRSRIFLEEPSTDNPYIAENCYCHGYNVLDLMQNRSYIDTLYLYLRGRLPTQDEERLLNVLMAGLSNPGPRHPATRASMNAAIGKTEVTHILPISLLTLSGTYLGAGEVEESMRFIKKSIKIAAKEIVFDLVTNGNRPNEGDWHIVPGFGTRFGAIEIFTQRMASFLSSLPGCGDAMHWCRDFVTELQQYGIGWLSTGLAAAVFLDLGFHPRSGPGLYQIASATGLLAHGLEMANQPITEMPFLSDENYVIKDESNEN